MEYRILTEREEAIINLNLARLGNQAKVAEKCCEAPGCKCPLQLIVHPTNENYVPKLGRYAADVGQVCELCFEMYAVLRDRVYWVEQQREWRIQNKKS